MRLIVDINICKFMNFVDILTLFLFCMQKPFSE